MSKNVIILYEVQTLPDEARQVNKSSKQRANSYASGSQLNRKKIVFTISFPISSLGTREAKIWRKKWRLLILTIPRGILRKKLVCFECLTHQFMVMMVLSFFQAVTMQVSLIYSYVLNAPDNRI